MPGKFYLAKTIATAIILFSLSGCGQKSIVGSWKSEGPVPLTLNLKSDKQATLTASAMGMSINLQGTYEVKENRLILSNFKPQNSGTLGGMLDQAAGFAKDIPTEFESTFNWKSDDTIVLNGPGPLNGAFKRQAPDQQ